MNRVVSIYVLEFLFQTSVLYDSKIIYIIIFIK
jgi:hypothetical protein